MDPMIAVLPEQLSSNDEAKKLIWLKGEFMMVVVSHTLYFIILIKSIKGLIKTKDWHFIFLLIASSFALLNNTNDIYYRVTAPLKDFNIRNCNDTFLTQFLITASLKWVPISYYQISRLYRICVNYYKRNWYIGIISVSCIFSLLYSIMYFLNLKEFIASPSAFGGCVVSNTSNYIKYVEMFDIIDTGYSLLVVIWTLFISLNNLKRYKLRHLKIKSIFDENMFYFFILVVTKIIFYHLIEKSAPEPGGDVWWDALAIVVLACAYRLMNLKPRLNEKLEDSMYQGNQKLINELSNLAKNAPREFEETTKSKKKKGLMRNSKGEINFPSLIKKNNTFNINQDHFIFNNTVSNSVDKPSSTRHKRNHSRKSDFYVNEMHSPRNTGRSNTYTIASGRPQQMVVHSPTSPFNNVIVRSPTSPSSLYNMSVHRPTSPTSPYNNNVAIQSPTTLYVSLQRPTSPPNPYNNVGIQGTPSNISVQRPTSPTSTFNNLSLQRSNSPFNNMAVQSSPSLFNTLSLQRPTSPTHSNVYNNNAVQSSVNPYNNMAIQSPPSLYSISLQSPAGLNNVGLYKTGLQNNTGLYKTGMQSPNSSAGPSRISLSNSEYSSTPLTRSYKKRMDRNYMGNEDEIESRISAYSRSSYGSKFYTSSALRKKDDIDSRNSGYSRSSVGSKSGSIKRKEDTESRVSAANTNRSSIGTSGSDSIKRKRSDYSN